MGSFLVHFAFVVVKPCLWLSFDYGDVIMCSSCFIFISIYLFFFNNAKWSNTQIQKILLN